MANAILNVGQTGGQVNISTAAAPATPAAGVVTLYAGTDKALHALNSDGLDITIGSGGAASPITVVNTDSLISNAIGATAGTKTKSLALGLNATTSQNCSVVVGGAACAQGSNPGAVVIGYGARSPLAAFSESGANVAIGFNAIANGSDQGVNRLSVAIGPNTKAGTAGGLGSALGIGIGNCVVDGSIGLMGNVCSSNSVNVGSNTFTVTSSCFTSVFGYGNTVNANTNCSTLIGAYSILCSGASKSVVVGDNAQAIVSCSVAIGSGATGGSVSIGAGAITCDPNQIAIGQGVGFTKAYTSPTAGFVLIGGSNNSLQQCAAWNNPNLGSVTIGYLNDNCNASVGVVIGTCNSQYNTVSSNAPYNHSAIIGHCIKNYANYAYGFGSGLVICATATMTVGDQLNSFSTGGQIFGFQSSINTGSDYGSLLGSNNSIGTSAVCAGAFGKSNTICNNKSCSYAFGAGNTVNNNKAVAIGAGITTEKDDTTHVNNLIAFGQAASKTNAIGSTGGTVTLNWDNSNIQTLSLTSSISTLTKSNPIDGAVYTVFVTQAGSGSYTVDWGSDVNWPGGTPPTLSTAVGAVDAISLVYVAGVTGYFGNANLNFS